MKTFSRQLRKTFLPILITIFLPVSFAQALEVLHSAPAATHLPKGASNSVTFNSERGDYIFRYQDDEHTYEYFIHTKNSAARKGMINIRAVIDDRLRFLPLVEGGLMIRNATGELFSPLDFAQSSDTELVYHRMVEDHVHFFYKETINGQTRGKTYNYSIKGKTLILRVTAQNPENARGKYAGFDFGKSRFIVQSTPIELPNSPVPILHIFNRLFHSTYVDPLMSTTADYTTTIEQDNTRSIQVSNTPAHIRLEENKKAPDIDITAYVTLSDYLYEVVPAPPAIERHKDTPLTQNVVLDLDDLPLADYPLKPVAMIRGWQAPESGKVKLKGQFTLQNGRKASCEVHYRQPDGSDHVLFSQILEPLYKPITSIEGEFPVNQDDELLFITYGPGIMYGGETAMDIRFKFNGKTYRSTEDFSNQQGYKGWFYEQQIGNKRSRLIWNPQTLQWESLNNRSFQTRERMVSLAGADENGFRHAELFFNELRSLGMMDLAFFLYDWPQKAGEEAEAWGTPDQLKQTTLKERVAKNTLVHIPDLSQIQQTFQDKDPSSEPITWSRIFSQIQEKLDHDAKVMSYDAVMLEPPAPHDYIPGATSIYQLFPDNKRGSQELANKLKDSFHHLRNDRQLILRDNDRLPYLAPFISLQLDGYYSPYTPPTGKEKSIIDDTLHLRRFAPPRIGMGSLTQFFQSDEQILDPRFVPMDHYLTSTIAHGRIPYISTDFWYPGLRARDLRKHMLEVYRLLKPVAREYLDTQSRIQTIQYVDEEGSWWDVFKAFQLDEWKTPARLRIFYDNGLRIYINNEYNPWSFDHPFLEDKKIDGDGFLAVNEDSNLISMIGRTSSLRFSFYRQGKNYFLHSRDGEFLRMGSFATDGMLSTWPSTTTNQHDMAVIAATEVRKSETMTPLFRSNTRIDFAVQWLSQYQMRLKILQVSSQNSMLEYFDFPQDWLEDKSGITLERTNRLQQDREPITYWSITKSADTKGIRVPNVTTGDVITVTFQ